MYRYLSWYCVWHLNQFLISCFFKYLASTSRAFRTHHWSAYSCRSLQSSSRPMNCVKVTGPSCLRTHVQLQVGRSISFNMNTIVSLSTDYRWLAKHHNTLTCASGTATQDQQSPPQSAALQSSCPSFWFSVYVRFEHPRRLQNECMFRPPK